MSFAEVKKNFGFGCMRLPMQGEEVDLAQFSQMVDEYLAAVNMFCKLFTEWCGTAE